MIRRIALPLVLLLVFGCDGDGRKTFQQAGEHVGQSVTDFAKGVAKGVDNRLEVPVELSEAVANLGLRITTAKTSDLTAGEPGKSTADSDKTITVYFIARRPVKEWLRAVALNAKGDEIGRATAAVELSADDAKYVSFVFDKEMDSQLVEKYVVEIGKAMPAEPKTPATNAPTDEPAKKE